MPRILCALLVALLCGTAWVRAADAPASNYQVPYADLRAAAKDYLDACVSAKDVEAMAKKLKQQVETKVSDSGIDEDRAMREIMLDWAAGNESKIRKKDPKAIRQACFYFIKFIDKNFAMPWQIRESFTEENVNKILEYLRDEAKKGGGKGGEGEKDGKKDEKKDEKKEKDKKK